jgi:hypothetical protein
MLPNDTHLLESLDGINDEDDDDLAITLKSDVIQYLTKLHESNMLAYKNLTTHDLDTQMKKAKKENHFTPHFTMEYDDDAELQPELEHITLSPSHIRDRRGEVHTDNIIDGRRARKPRVRFDL